MKKLDPRTRLYIVIFFSTLAVCLKDTLLLGILVILAITAVVLSGVQVFGLLKRLRHFLLFFLLIGIIQVIFTKSGQVLFSFSGMTVTQGGLGAGISILLRMLTVIFSVALLSVSPPTELVAGLVAWGLPYEIAFMVFLGLKFLPSLAEELKDCLVAVQLAGADLKRIPLREKLSVFAYVLTPAVAAALERAKQVAIAAEARGFRAFPRRTSWKTLKMCGSDWGVILITTCLGMSIVLLSQWRGFQ